MRKLRLDVERLEVQSFEAGDYVCAFGVGQTDTVRGGDCRGGTMGCDCYASERC